VFLLFPLPLPLFGRMNESEFSFPSSRDNLTPFLLSSLGLSPPLFPFSLREEWLSFLGRCRIALLLSLASPFYSSLLPLPGKDSAFSLPRGISSIFLLFFLFSPLASPFFFSQYKGRLSKNKGRLPSLLSFSVPRSSFFLSIS